jgi:hypothetical protein
MPCWLCCSKAWKRRVKARALWILIESEPGSNLLF